ncbi:hypothetical protein [Thiomicrospira sp. XS5]|jgi:hypothetical protein|uniref:hypothetical protein n=1 Tax=Thiomicrospira sp. XS5 TaxID=1775636 RepID=UPI000AAD9AE2|nr:hypothetical protein [Thiomicrospira sp. XS5]
MVRNLLILTNLFILAGCSHQAVYDNIQHNNRNSCYKKPPSQYDACMKAANKPYDQYEREREEVSAQ